MGSVQIPNVIGGMLVCLSNMETVIYIHKLINELNKTRFNTKGCGVPFAKKMWGNGYNECLDRILKILDEDTMKLLEKQKNENPIV